MDEIAISVRVTGKVQGVWFRGWTRQIALARGLRGWVRNDTDGSVAVLLIGQEDAVTGMLRELQSGPPAARVGQVKADTTDVQDMPPGFEVRY